jgi:2-dehydro-3-deoxygluconokinase
MSTSISYHRAGSAGSRLRPEDLDPEAIASAAVLHCSGVTPALSASAREATLHAMGVAAAAGVIVAFDVNYRSLLWPPELAAPVLASLAACSSILFAGRREAELLVGTGLADHQLMRALAELGPRIVVLTGGAGGAAALVDGQVHKSPGMSVITSDPVGAGDACAGAFLAAHIQGRDVGNCLDQANAVGAIAAATPGEWVGLPNTSELRAFVDSHSDVSR